MDRAERVEAMERAIIEALGVDGALNEIIKALTSQQKEDIYDFICRMYDLDIGDDAEEEEQ